MHVIIQPIVASKGLVTKDMKNWATLTYSVFPIKMESVMANRETSTKVLTHLLSWHLSAMLTFLLPSSWWAPEWVSMEVVQWESWWREMPRCGCMVANR